MDEEPIKKTLHRYYDLIAGGVCLIRQTAEEQILFVNDAADLPVRNGGRVLPADKGALCGADGGGGLHTA